MRPIARQSARLANCQRLRAPSRPRSPAAAVQQRRTFQVSASQLAADSRPPPPGTPDRARALEEQLERQRVAGEEDVRQEQSGAEGAGADGRRPGLRRTYRQRRVAEVPKPPPLPEWFLRRNVLLVPEEEGVGGGLEGTRRLRCVDAQSGHTLFHVPYCPGEEQEERAKGEAEEVAKKEQDEQAKKASIPGISMLGDNFFQQKFDGEIPVVLGSENDLPLGFKFSKDGVSSKYDPLSWTMLETEASVLAAMGASAQSGPSSSHAASRSDIHLHCPDSNAYEHMDQYVRDMARVLRADLIRLDANDIADLTSDYVGGSSDLPGSFSTLGYDVYDGAVANGLGLRGLRPEEHADPEEFDEDEEDAQDSMTPSMNLGHFGSFDDLTKALGDKRHGINKMLGNFGIAGVSVAMPPGSNSLAPQNPAPSQNKRNDPADYISWDDARLAALLEGLLDAPSVARSKASEKALTADGESAASSGHDESKSVASWPSRAGGMVADVAKLIKGREGVASSTDPADSIRLEAADGVNEGEQRTHNTRRTILQVRDLKPIMSNRLGESIIKRLVRVVQKRRRAGEEIVVIGTTAADVFGPLDSLMDTHEDSPFRLIVLPPLFDMSPTELSSFHSSALAPPSRSIYQPPSYDRIANVNMRHISSMLSRLGHDLQSTAIAESFQKLHMPGTHILSEKVLPQDQIQRLVLTAVGLSQSHARAQQIAPIHIALATAVLARADHAVHSWTSFNERQRMGRATTKGGQAGKNTHGSGTAQPSKGQARIDAIKKDCNQHETRLLAGVVDPQNIKTGFSDVHASPDSIEALKSMTTLSLLRPDAFQYGVLANDRLTGLLLYGPPGTGKTLLAKAVAKESGATVLEVSGAQIYEKYVGEGEKMVRAVFSLAKKLSPCVVFIDEADAIFGSRGGSGNRNTHREIINQFLREWDGMDDNSIFMMVASNRPFDLDDAVLRRLPRRLLVDLPVAKDRESILGIHLRHEALDSSVDLAALSEQTPLYSGSDLKNLCVSAALAAVREENELVEQNKGDKEFKLPEKRTLTAKHFDKAVAEISASINEDMSSLTAIRKFDEQFGDRRGRKKKSGYGFGTGDDSVDESSARVRPGT